MAIKFKLGLVFNKLSIVFIVSSLSMFHFIFHLSPVLADEEKIVLQKAPIDLTDLASLQRGAKLFMNLCSGCHSLKYIRYDEMAKGIGLVNAKGNLLEKALQDNLIFGDFKPTDPIIPAMTKEEGTNWFFTAPPDLSLVVRQRGADWVYTFLKSFYPDDKKTWGVNNHVFPDVAMPYVLLTLQKKVTPEVFDQSLVDLVNFLTYISEPNQIKRKHLGIWVLTFLGIFFIFTWLLKREYWKDV